ncbi:hypothetical protein D3C77_426180 [compost metagenome]
MQVGDVGHSVDARIASPVGGGFPGPVPGDRASRAADEAVGVGFLEELSGPRFCKSSLDEGDVLTRRIGRIGRRDLEVSQSARRRELVALPVGEEDLAEQADSVRQLIVRQEGRADAFDRRYGVKEGVRVEVVLGGVVGLEEIPVAARRLVEIDLLAVRKHGPAADRRRAGDAGQLAVDLAQTARGAAGQIDGFRLLIGQGGGNPAAVAPHTPQQVEGEVLAVTFIRHAVLA